MPLLPRTAWELMVQGQEERKCLLLSDPMLTRAVRNTPLPRESLPQTSLRARILLRICHALVWPVDLSVFGAHLPSMNDQVSNMQLPAQPWWLPGNAGWAPCWAKIGQVKAQGTTMLSQLISLLPIALNAANYCWWKATLSPPFEFFFSSNADIYSFVLLP